MPMQTVPSNYGLLHAPSSLAELLELIGGCSENHAGQIGWRGQADLSWTTDVPVVRRLKLSHPHLFDTVGRTSNQVIEQVEKINKLADAHEQVVLDEARRRGFHRGYDAKELETLAVLRHHGAATRFIDFSQNAFVALWMACTESPHTDGLLVGAHLDFLAGDADSTRVCVMHPSRTWTPAGRVFAEFAQCNFVVWPAPPLDLRMAAQHGLFIVSRATGLHAHGTFFDTTLQFDPGKPFANKQPFIGIAVPVSLKSELNRCWEKLFGYSVAALFPDVDGFSRHFNSASAPSPELVRELDAITEEPEPVAAPGVPTYQVPEGHRLTVSG